MPFENLDAWKKPVRLSVDIYKELRAVNDFSFKGQITRFGLSIPSNIAEGMEKRSQKKPVISSPMPEVHVESYGHKFISEWKLATFLQEQVQYGLRKPVKILPCLSG